MKYVYVCKYTISLKNPLEKGLNWTLEKFQEPCKKRKEKKK